MTSALAYLVGVLVIVAGLAVSIGLHELGHLLPAKRFGVRVTQWMIGFGPTVASRRIGETEYGLKAIPLGGYIRMIGMFPPPGPADETGPRGGARGWAHRVAADAKRVEQEDYDPADLDRTFHRLTVPRKLVVMLGGPTMNLLLSAVFLLLLLCGTGIPTLTSTVAAVPACLSADGTCGPGDAASPAHEAGLRAGDRIVAVGGTATADWDDVVTAVRASGTDPVEITYRRDGSTATATLTPVLVDRPVLEASGEPVLDPGGDPVTEEVAQIGIAGAYTLERRSPAELPARLWSTFTATGEVVLTLPQRLVEVAQAAFGAQERDPNGPIGVVGVGRIAGEVASVDRPGFELADRTATMLGVLASLNMALFVFNLIPLLPLDGGHVAGALIEGARRRVSRARGLPDPGAVDMSRMLPLTYVVVGFFLIMTVLLVYADIVRPVTLFGP